METACLAALLLLAAPAVAPQPDADTVLLWHLDEPEGARVDDSSPTAALAGASTGAARVPGRFGQALAWATDNGNVSVKGDFSRVRDAFTLSAWVRLDRLPTGTPPFWTSDVAGRLGSLMISIRPPGVLYAGVQLGTQPNWLLGTTRIAVGEWTHVALVYDGAAGVIATFVNGVLDRQFDVPPGMPLTVNDSGNPFWLRSYGGGDEKLVGAIDEVQLSVRAESFGQRWEHQVDLHLLRYRPAFLLGGRLRPRPGGALPALRLTVTAAGQPVLDRRVPAAELADGVETPLPGAAAGVYHARVAAVDADGTEEVVVDRDYRYVPPDKALLDLSPDGVCLRRGQPFFPLGLYHVRSADLPRVAEAGFNLAMSQPPDASWPPGTGKGDGVGYVERAGELGLMSVGKGFGFRLSAEHRAAFEHYRGSPGLLFWYVTDEPSGQGLKPDDVLAGYEEWAAADPTHPIFLLDNTPAQFARYSPACDIFATDPYPIHRDDDPPLRHVFDQTRAAVQAVHGRKPVWAALQSYTVKALTEAGRPRGGVPRLPHEDELRCMSYLALAAGARGIIYYSFDDSYWNPGEVRGVNLAHEYPEYWSSLSRVARELAGRAEVWTAPWSSLRPRSRTPLAAVSARAWQVGGEALFLVVNPTKAELPVEVELPGVAVTEAREVFDGGRVAVKEGVLSDVLPMRAARLYAVAGR